MRTRPEEGARESDNSKASPPQENKGGSIPNARTYFLPEGSGGLERYEQSAQGTHAKERRAIFVMSQTSQVFNLVGTEILPVTINVRHF